MAGAFAGTDCTGDFRDFVDSTNSEADAIGDASSFGGAAEGTGFGAEAATDPAGFAPDFKGGRDG